MKLLLILVMKLVGKGIVNGGSFSITIDPGDVTYVGKPIVFKIAGFSSKTTYSFLPDDFQTDYKLFFPEYIAPTPVPVIPTSSTSNSYSHSNSYSRSLLVQRRQYQNLHRHILQLQHQHCNCSSAQWMIFLLKILLVVVIQEVVDLLVLD